jgi:type I restriction enzyme, S subunit
MSINTHRKGYKSVKWLFGKEIEIPEEWNVVKLEKYVSLKHGFAFNSKDFIQSEGVKVIKIKNIKNNGTVNLSNTDCVAFTLAKGLKQYLIKQNELIIALTGATLGKIAIVKTKEKLLQNQRVGNIFSINESLLDNTFLFFIISNYLQNQIWSLVSALAQPNIGKSELDKMKIILPSIQEQQKIATILSNMDALIESTSKVIQNTKLLKKSLMQKLLTQGISHTKFKKIPWLFGKEIEIPKEWKWQQISNNSTIKGRIGWQGLTTKEYRHEGQFYLVTGTDFKNGRIDWDNCVYVDENRYLQDKNIQLKKNDVLITKDGTIGKIAYVNSLSILSTLNTGVFVVRPIDGKYISLFFYHILFSDYFIKFLNRLKAGSTINHLYQRDFNTFYFPLPSIQEQQKIATILSNVDSQIESQEQYKEKLQRLKKSLMQKLLTGEVRVKV